MSTFLCHGEKRERRNEKISTSFRPEFKSHHHKNYEFTARCVVKDAQQKRESEEGKKPARAKRKRK